MLPRIQVSPDNRSLQTEQGQPFFWLGDTAWELLQRLTLEEIAHYLSVRQAQGFNLVQTVALAEFGELGPNHYGLTPLLNQDPRTPNPAFFDFVEQVIQMAAQRGLYLALLPTWGDKVTPGWGAGPAVFDAANARVYGAWLSQRLGHHTNLVWIVGGDRPALRNCYWDRSKPGWEEQVDDRPLWRAMAEGILEHSPKALITFHTAGGKQPRTSTHLHTEPWLHFNSMQSGHGGGHDSPFWEWLEADLTLLPAKPVMDLEPNYEDHPVNPWPTWNPLNGYFRDHDVRKQLWRGILAGGAGVSYGHQSVWQFYAPGREPITYPDRSWLEALHRPGAIQAGIMRRLIEQHLPYRLPQQALLASEAGRGGSHVRAAISPDARTALVYIPNSQTVLINLEMLKGQQLEASWLDPRTGEAKVIAQMPAKGQQMFTTPIEQPDWVLAVKRIDKTGG